EEHGRIHHLVNNAGGQFPAPLVGINQKGFEAVVRTNLVGGFLVAKEVFIQSLSKHGGSIVNMLADMWGGMPGMGHSGAARAGMENFTKTAAYEWGHAGVRVNAVAPGWVASSGMDTYPDAMKNMIRSLKDHVPLQRIATEAEIASAIVFLLSPGASFISGNTIGLDAYPDAMTNMTRSLKDHVPRQRIATEAEIASAIVFLLSPGASFISGNTIRIDGAASLGTRAWTLGKARNSESYNGFHRACQPDVLKDGE